ncbi:flagellar export chaperone FliS [Solemya pervernicosa gill symbiont]|uniref:Flagellar secretion chaperone FliS n=1 Tax=Solemya pervernicosa gill symbiont TaxID=642797 RepID=A0A1T2LAI5_9GAMM|nr:flagellar export chaperone FliS [Solemya pervernicosa gill symbiont]OOZ42117.1 flagellar export chaperone FliS [Solemya pervernicosa gill symbiont]
MTYSKPTSKMQQYTQYDVKAEVLEASPHRLVQMLIEGALDKVAVAKGHMERNDVAGKGQYISWAISIIEGLRASIDKEAGGEIANNLDDLYDYLGRRLLQANLDNDVSILDEASSLLREIKSAWDAIPSEVKGERAKITPNYDSTEPPTSTSISIGV